MDGLVFKIRSAIDSDYEVYDANTYEVYFQGSLADCESYIRLSLGGFM